MPSTTSVLFPDPYHYTDGQSHRLVLRPAVSEPDRIPYVWAEAENLAFGGDVVHVWLTLEQAAGLEQVLAQASDDAGSLRPKRQFRAVDHTGDVLTVWLDSTWTVFEVTRKANDDEEAAAVRVVVLTGRLPELRRAFTAAAECAQQRAAGETEQPATVAAPKPRVLTPGEHDRAWHAIEGAAGEPGADPGTILTAVLAALDIQAPSAEDEQAAGTARRSLSR
ncbi:hypothetical protein ACIBAC_00565 [Streptomyces sp. NPDC051362]|uniref:hypothetical protein n=1 Tax=Streptomyces sp. NPDC051362 TaxID=3365651 RepID=UPI00379B7E6D